MQYEFEPKKNKVQTKWYFKDIGSKQINSMHSTSSTSAPTYDAS